MNPNTFNIAEAAESYSSLSGIMAGFSFAVLVWLVERLNLKDANHDEDILVIRALVFLGITFLGNLLTSFFWALVHGESQPGLNRPQSLAYIATWMMAMMAPLTMLAITLVVATAGSNYAIKLFRRIFGVTVLIGLAFLWTETRGILMVYQGSPNQSPTDIPLLWVEVMTLGVMLLGYLLSRRRPTQRFGLDTENSFANFTGGLLLATLGAAFTFANLAIAPLSAQIPTVALMVANGIWVLFAFWACAYLPKT
jgi:hypothetical protein